MNKAKDSEWPWDQAANAAAVTTRKVMEQNYPILRVTHYEDDHSWAFTCNTSNTSDQAMIVTMGQVIRTDPTLIEICDLPPGWSAWREKVGNIWKREKIKGDL